MFELSSLYCKIKITKFQLEKFLKNPLEKPQLNHNWLEWWDSQKMHSQSVLTEELLRSYNYDINKEVVDKWMKHPKALTFSDYNEITEEWHWGILFFSQNFIEMLPMLAFIISMESYVTESTENMAIVFPFFLGENNVHSYIEFKDGKAILNPKVKKIKDLEPIKIQDATDYLTQKWAELGEKVKNELKYDEIRESVLATDETIQSLSAYFLQPIPETLINFYKTVGGIESDETFSIFSVENLLNQIQERTNLRHNSTGIIDMIIAFWANDRPEFQEYKFLTEEQTQKINETFPCIGWMMSEEDINESGEYVIFDKNGNFANIYCHQDKIKSTVNQLLKLLETGLPERSLENVLEELFERAEGNLSRWN